MKPTFYYILLALVGLLLSANSAFAQKKDTTELNIDNIRIIITENGDTIKKKKPISGRHTISIGSNGIKYVDKLKKKKKKHKKLHTGMHFDFGFNNVIDNTKYNTLGLQVADSTVRTLTANDLELKNGRSINFNFWPLWLKQDIAKHNVQIETGLGFQFFNYRYETNIRHLDIDPNAMQFQGLFPPASFRNETNPDNLRGKEKNKLGVSYVSIPLMLRFNSNKKNGHRYFVGAGVIGSYKLKSWTKFYGEKESGNYAINDWMTQVSAELGITGIIKLYGTYALQSMYSNGIDRRPFAIGIRL